MVESMKGYSMIDLDKLYAAVDAAGISRRRFNSLYGGERRVKAWAKKCHPRMLGGVSHALKVPIQDLLVTGETKSVAAAETVEVVIEAPEVQEPPKKKKSPSQMNKEELIVEAHRLDPDIDLPDKATKKELIKIVKSLK